jgi:type II secretory pathway pseudopilin PulG
METVLLVITIVSAATAIAALTSARRVQRGERQRSNARVAALSAAADAARKIEGGWTQVAGEWQWAPEPQRPDAITNPESPIPGVAGSLGVSGNMFGTVQRDEPTTNRAPLMAAAALFLIVGGALVLFNSYGSPETTATIAKVAHDEPIELVALDHARDVSVLTISGAVRNPSKGVKLEGLTAVVSLLDRDGALVSTKDVPLDYRALRPGEEAPFKVSIPNPGSITRYRVSFRAGTEVVPHVDRRTDSKLASAIN